VRTFQRDKSIQRGSKTAIPSDRLLVYAQMFGCSMEELYTQTGLQKRDTKILRANIKTALS
jgi:5-bromo-4-chloroindolyl phosphate hydrolysis protein